MSDTPTLSGRVFAAGKNYAAHVAAMGDGPAPARPLIFTKHGPPVPPGGDLWVPPGCGGLHPEAELVVLVGRPLRGADAAEAAAAPAGFAAGLDMTDRALQRDLKRRGHPWDAAKAFDGAAALGPVIPVARSGDWRDLEVRLATPDPDGGPDRPLQLARARDMTLGVPDLLAYLSERFTLRPGDLVFTGAPAATEEVRAGDRLVLELVGLSRSEFGVSATRPGS